MTIPKRFVLFSNFNTHYHINNKLLYILILKKENVLYEIWVATNKKKNPTVFSLIPTRKHLS